MWNYWLLVIVGVFIQHQRFALFPLGKMFQAPDLNLIVEFIFMFYKEKPIDWLLDHILWVKVCNPEKDAVRFALCLLNRLAAKKVGVWVSPFSPFFFKKKHCERQKSSLRVRFRPSLFQHVGLHSSLAGKIQKLTVSLTPSQLSIFSNSRGDFLSRHICFSSVCIL